MIDKVLRRDIDTREQSPKRHALSPTQLAVRQSHRVGAVVVGGEFHGLGVVRSLAGTGCRSVSSTMSARSRACHDTPLTPYGWGTCAMSVGPWT